MGIEQKVVIIIGASQGIGAALVKAYRDRNYRDVIADKEPDFHRGNFCNVIRSSAWGA